MATGDSYSDIGGVRKVALGAPETMDQAGFNALTWVRLKGVVSMPEMGDEFEDVGEGTLDDGRMKHLAGGVDGGVLDVPVLYIEGDAGQVLLSTHVGDNQEIAWQDVDVDGTARFFHGVLLSAKRREKTRSSQKGTTYKVGVNSPIFTGVENS